MQFSAFILSNYLHCSQAVQHSSKGDLCYDNLAAVVQGSEAFEFLDEVIPQRVTAEDAAAINLHLKMAQGVNVHLEKKASCSCGNWSLPMRHCCANMISQARVDTC